MSLFHRVAMPVLGVAGVLFAVPFSAIAADDEHAGHDMSAMDHQSTDHSGHDTGSGTHIHHQHMAGGWMFEYKFMRMTMDGLLDGTDSIDPADVTGTVALPGPYMMSPTKMTMDMHMVMAMYGLNDKISLMGMLNYLKKGMDMVNRMGVDSSMDTSGVGDTQIGMMYTLDKNLMASVNLSVPTGSIDERGPMGANPDAQLPYPMQLGSGTYDLIPSVTYKAESGHWGWGGQGTYTYRLGENDNDYTLGNRLELTAWLKRRVNSNVLLSGRLNWSKWDDIDGADPDLNPMMAPTTDPDAQGGRRLDALVGISGMFSGGHMLGLEIGKPIMQDLNGPQMETDLLVSIAYQYMAM